MADLEVTEFTDVGLTGTPAAKLPAVRNSYITTLTTSPQGLTPNAFFGVQTTVIRIDVAVDTRVEVGQSDVSVAATSMRMLAGTYEYFDVQPGDYLSARTA